MPKFGKIQSYPTAKAEYHIVTPTGVVSCIFEDKELALQRFAKCPAHWHLIEVTLSKVDVTPEDHDRTAPLQLHMSQKIFVTDDAPLAICA